MRTSALFYTEKQIALVVEIILNTDGKQAPSSQYAQIARDADLAVLGGADFFSWSTALREESKLHPESLLHPFSLDDTKWIELQLYFFASVDWFTATARKLYQSGKEKNFARLQKMYTS